MMMSTFHCLIMMIVEYIMAGVYGESRFNPGQFSEQDLSKMGIIHSTYCDRDVNCNESEYYQQNNLQLVNHPRICCDRCSCDLSTCSKGRIECCPELINDFDSRVGTARCMHPILKPLKSKTQFIATAVKMISHCSKNTKNPRELIDKCENSLMYTDLDTRRPVTVLEDRGSITYVNRYCALCNDIDDTEMLLHWSTKFECRTSIPDVYVTSPEQIVEEVQNSEDCDLYFLAHAGIKVLEECGMGISECNVTGKWKRYDPLIEAACAMTYFSFFQASYRNVFCYLCNIGDDTMDIPVCDPDPHSDVSFSMVLKYIPTETSGDKTLTTPNFELCGNDEIYDSVQEKCLKVKCLMSNVYIAGECQKIVEEIKGVIFNVFLKMTPFERLVKTDGVLRDIGIFTISLLDELRLHNTAHLITMHKQMFSSSDLSETLYFVVSFEINSISFKIVDKSSIDILLGMHKSNISISPYFKGRMKYTLFLELDTTDSVLNRTSFSKNHSALLPVLFCPLVELNASFYHFEYSLNGVFIKEFNTHIDRNAYIKTDGSVIAICKSTFAFLLDRLKQNRTTYGSTRTILGKTPVGMLSLVCSSVSIWCSCITFLVYLRVKSMHTQPGINTMCLVVSLICAQTFYQFGIGQAQNIPTWTCSLIGGLVHYFWIVTILWMNVCTYHMFQLFRKFTNVDFSRSFRRTTCRYWLYCSLVALVPVLANMVVMYSTNGSTGYGGYVCYISDNKMVGFCFVLPVAVVIVANWLMLVYTIFKISSQTSVKKLRQEEKKYLLVYAKMSTLTGMTWIFGFLFFFINVDVLEYLFVIFNAGQGVFLFLSFVCNKRIWKLLIQSNERNLTSQTSIRRRP